MGRTAQTSMIEGMAAKFGFDEIRIIYDEAWQKLDPDEYDYSEDLVRRVFANIVGVRHENLEANIGENEERVELGHIRGELMFFGQALNTGESVVDAADDTADTCHAAEVLHELFESEDNVGFGHTGIHIQEIFLKPEYRKQNLGAVVLRRFIDWHDPSSLFAVVLVPNDRYFFSSGKRENDPLASVKDGKAKLVAWYKSLGFQKFREDKEWLALDGESYDNAWRWRRRKSHLKTGSRT